MLSLFTRRRMLTTVGGAAAVGGRQTLANMALNGVSGEFGVEVFCGGLGRTHFVVDIQGLPVDLDLPDLTLRCGSLSVGIAVNAVQ